MLLFRVIKVSSDRIITCMSFFIFFVNLLILQRKIPLHFLFIIFSVLTLHNIKLSDLWALILEFSIWCWVHILRIQVISWNWFIIYWVVDISHYLFIFPLKICDTFAFKLGHLSIQSNDIVGSIVFSSHLQIGSQRSISIFLKIFLKFYLLRRILVFLKNWIKLSLLLSHLIIANSLSNWNKLLTKRFFSSLIFFIGPHLIFPALIFLLVSPQNHQQTLYCVILSIKTRTQICRSKQNRSFSIHFLYYEYLIIQRFLNNISIMKNLNIDITSLDKHKEINESELIQKNLKEVRRKIVLERKLKSFEPDLMAFETKQNSPSKIAEEKLLSEQKDFREIRVNRDRSSVEDQSKQTKSSIKLPNINSRNNARPSVDFQPEGGLDMGENTDAIIEKVQANSVGVFTNPKRKSVTKDHEIEDEEKVGNFLKYIQIRSMKPAEKVIQPKSDLSIRELRPIKIERLISTKVNKTKEEQSMTKFELKRSEKTMKMKRSELRSQKSISSHSVTKQKKAMSTSKPVRKKVAITNSYWDFCDFICLLNRVETPTLPLGTYKAFVGKGNNSILIKNSLKNRFWWNIVDDSLDVNLYWTQLRDVKFIQNLKTMPSPKQPEQAVLSEQLKPIVFNLPKEGGNQKNDTLKVIVGSGLQKFLSNDEKKRLSNHPHHTEIPKEKNLRKLGNPHKNKIHNHLEHFWHLSNKKALYYNLKKFYEAMGDDPFIYVPLTFHVQKIGDSEWENFIKFYFMKDQEIKQKHSESKTKKKKQKNMWIVKPGENSNQGCGIQVFDNIEEISDMVKNTQRSNGRQRSYIIQKYLMPFLYNKRKFDIRTYVLFTSVNGIYKAYWYEEGYIRTSCKEFTIKNLKNRFIHLTNDAVQKKSEDYGKYENGNKLSYMDFQKYLDQNFPDKEYDFYRTVYPAMMKRATDAMKSACMLLDPNKREFTFEIFGLDFMIDDNFETWLIEVNTNPCLDLGSPLLARIIPNMIQNALKIAVDPIFPPPKEFPKTKSIPTDVFESNKFTLIFNSREEQDILINLTKDTNLSNIIESDQEEEMHEDYCQY